jgi:hypothetical protein
MQTIKIKRNIIAKPIHLSFYLNLFLPNREMSKNKVKTKNVPLGVSTLRNLFAGSRPSQFLFSFFPPQVKQWDCDKKKVCNLQIFHSNHSDFPAGCLTAALSVQITV